MSRKRTAAALGAGVLSALLAGGVVAAPAASAAEAEDSAYAIAADGLLDVPKTPHVVGSGEESLLAVDLPPDTGDIVHLGIFNAEAEKHYAKASTTELKVALPGAPVVEAELLAAECATDDKGKPMGSTSIINLRVGDQAVALDQIPPNTTIVPEQLEGVASLTLNKQVSNEDGSLTVTALAVDVLSGAPVVGELLGQSVDLSSATCHPDEDGKDDGEDDNTTTPSEPSEDNGDDGDNGDNGGDDNGDNGDDDEADENGNAPVPTPQEGHLSVTG